MKPKPKMNEQQTSVTILRRAMLFSLTRCAWRNRRLADQSKIQADCAEGKLKTTKRLVGSEALKKCYQHLSQAYAWCLERSMVSTVRRGVYFVSRDMVSDFETYLLESNRVMRDELVPAFLAEYEEAKNKAKLPASEGGLGALYNEADYPAPAELAERFGIEWSWMALSVPSELPEEVRQRECDKLRETFEQAQTEVTFALREGFKSIVDNAVDLLDVKPGQKPRKFTEKTVQTFDRFFSTFRARNLMDDKELESLVEVAKSLIANMDVKKVSEPGDMRTEVARSFEGVADQLAALVAERPKRAFDLSFGEDETD